MSNYSEIITNQLSLYKVYGDKYMIQIPNSSTYKALYYITDEQIIEYITFF